MTTEALTEREQQCLDYLEQARSLGVSLREFATAYGLNVSDIYNCKSQLTKKGVLPAKASAAPEDGEGQFVAVRVEPPREKPRPRETPKCRVIHANGHVIEFSEWPAESWIAALLNGEPNAAA